MADWVRNFNNFPLQTPFMGVPGLKWDIELQPHAEPIDFYLRFITPDVIKLMKRETNRYAASAIQQKRQEAARNNVQLSARSIFNTWHTVTEDEIRKFLSIIVHMGLVQKSKITDYWCRDPTVATIWARPLMARERFRSILAFFHLNDNGTFIPRGEAGHDPLHKLRPFVDHLVQSFRGAYQPEENICIDEALCPWRGRSSFRVYMKDKPTKWGIKPYILSESQTGYAFNFEVYCNAPGVSNTPFDVCNRLLQPLVNLGHTLYVDNYYCCPKLADKLVAENTNVVGNVRFNRLGMPRDLSEARLAVGDVDYRRRNQTVALRWRDKRDVFLLTTKHTDEMVEVRSRAERKMKPMAVKDYTTNMAGVDHCDQMTAYYPFDRQTVKWWKKLAFHLLTLTMTQAHTLFNIYQRTHNRKTLTLRTFVMSVCRALGNVPAAAQDPPPPVPVREDQRLTERHFPSPIMNGDKKVQRACIVCYAKAVAQGQNHKELKNSRKQTQYQCEPCGKALCVHPCFMVYHTKQDYTV